MTTPAEYNAAEVSAGRLTFDHITELVRFWQTRNGLTVDGMAGPLTVASLTPVLERWLALPLPVLPDGRKPVITSGFREPDRPTHDGVDWFYTWKAGDQPAFIGDHGAAGSQPDGSPRWVVPIGVLAQASAGGVVQIASDSSTGHRVWVDHGNGWRTGYFHLLDVRVKTGDRVAIGASLGLVGDNPCDDDGRHLHFELSPVDRYEPIDPAPHLIAGL